MKELLVRNTAINMWGNFRLVIVCPSYSCVFNVVQIGYPLNTL